MAQTIKEMASGDDSSSFLKKIAEDLEKNPPEDKNKGHEKLMQDLTELLSEAYNYEFHDFKNRKYATPKVELNSKLNILAKNVIEGKYDN